MSKAKEKGDTPPTPVEAVNDNTPEEIQNEVKSTPQESDAAEVSARNALNALMGFISRRPGDAVIQVAEIRGLLLKVKGIAINRAELLQDSVISVLKAAGDGTTLTSSNIWVTLLNRGINIDLDEVDEILSGLLQENRITPFSDTLTTYALNEE